MKGSGGPAGLQCPSVKSVLQELQRGGNCITVETIVPFHLHPAVAATLFAPRPQSDALVVIVPWLAPCCRAVASATPDTRAGRRRKMCAKRDSPRHRDDGPHHASSPRQRSFGPQHAHRQSL